MKAVLYGFGGLPWAEHHKNENHHFSKELNKQRSGYNSYFDIVERCQKDVPPLDPHIAEGGGGGHSPPGVLDKLGQSERYMPELFADASVSFL